MPAPMRTASAPASTAPYRDGRVGIWIFSRKLTPIIPSVPLLAISISTKFATTSSSSSLRGGSIVGRDPLEAGTTAAWLGPEVAVTDACGDLGDRERVQCPAHVTSGIALVQSAGDGHGHRGSGDHAELALVGDGLCELPA